MISSKKDKANKIVKDYILEEIKEHRLTIGSRLPTELKLANTLQVGRNTVREALQELKGSGLITSNQGSGYCISDAPENALLKAIDNLLILKPISSIEISQIREALELKSIELIKKATKEDIEFLNQCIKQMKINSATAIEWDVKFHTKLAEMSNNTFINIFIQALSKFSNMYILISWNKILEKEKKELINIHQEIVNFVENNDIHTCKKKLIEHYDITSKILKNSSISQEKSSIQQILSSLLKEGYTEEDIYQVLISSKITSN